jgi:hypothetical protein
LINRSEDIALLVDQQWFSRYPYDNRLEFSTEFFERFRSYGVTAKPPMHLLTSSIHVNGAYICIMELHKRKSDDIIINTVLSPGQIVFGRDMIINATYLARWKYIQSKRQSHFRTNNINENQSRNPHQYVTDEAQGPPFLSKTLTQMVP